MAAGDEPTVLIVDDEKRIVNLYARQLDGMATVKEAYGGGDALEKANESVDVILLDRRMPGIPGDEVLEVLAERGYDPLVIMVTAVEPDFDIVEMSFDDYLVKPVTGDELRETVTRVLERAAFRQTARDYFAMASKQAALSGYKHPAQLESNEEYQRLQRKLDDLRDQADSSIEELGPEAVKELFQDLEFD